MRICLFGQGPLCEAVEAALEAQGHELLGPYATPQPTELLRATQASVGLSCGYRHKLTPEEWACFPDGILNLHTGYLPWNRGAYPNVWPILDGSPAGVTLHRVDEGIDTGPILWQAEIPVEPTDTAKTLYEKLIDVGVFILEKAVHSASLNGWHCGTPQDPKAGSFHRKAELARLYDDYGTRHCQGEGGYCCEPYEIDEFLPLLRAATFPGYGLRYRQDGKLIEATITLKEVTE